MDLDQIRTRLKLARDRNYPLNIQEFGLELTVNEEVFSPQDVQNWRWLAASFPPVAGKTILEIGCGSLSPCTARLVALLQFCKRLADGKQFAMRVNLGVNQASGSTSFMPFAEVATVARVCPPPAKPGS
ncbi:hypothetical protein ACDY97_17990 [Rhizobium mongolense]|uniref:hypothetical protein n=1 Tax=Rhizobium mongolense TaxID=57676 RepID=UPI0035591187